MLPCVTAINYDIIPRQLSTTTLLGEGANQTFQIKNLETENIFARIESELTITPSTIIIKPNTIETITINIPEGKPIGTYNQKIKVLISDSTDATTENITDIYQVIVGRNIGEICAIDNECYTKNCENNKCIKTSTTIDFGQHPGYNSIMIIATIVAIITIIFIKTRNMLSLTKNILIITTIFAVIIIGAVGLTIIAHQEKIQPKIQLGTNIISQSYTISPETINITAVKDTVVTTKIGIKNVGTEKIVITTTTELSVNPKILILDPLTEGNITITIPTTTEGEHTSTINIKIATENATTQENIPIRYTIRKI
jgi:hypothetical protein